MSGHQHLLVKDPTRLGWKCAAAGCGFFKLAEEFDGIALVGGGLRGVSGVGRPCASVDGGSGSRGRPS